MTGPRLDEEAARQLDADDPLASFRERFRLPTTPAGVPRIYLCGNSLGPMPTAVPEAIETELEAWERLGVLGHLEGTHPWYRYHEPLRDPAARIVGARPDEVVLMNSLTVNLHLCLVSFYRPTPERPGILMESPAFPSDTYAVQTQIRRAGFDPAEVLTTVGPAPGEATVRTEAILEAIESRGDGIALVLLGAVNFLTGQLFDVRTIAEAAHARGCLVGLDLAHAAGNVPLSLHDDAIDFAVWCSYKYLNGGPGAVAGCFVHERWARDPSLPRFGGWWGNDPETRFRMHLEKEFLPRPTADGWQLSNPPILSMAPLRSSLSLFDEAGMTALRAKSLRLTGFFRRLLERELPDSVEILTPDADEAHGCQLSLRLARGARTTVDRLERAGVIVDFREPDILRVAPAPLYNRFHEIWRFVRILAGKDDPGR